MSKIGKFKRIAIVVLFVMAFSALIFAFSGCDLNFSTTLEPVSSQDSTISGSDDSTSSGNTPTEGDCSHEHTTETNTATCTEDGYIIVVCDDCGEEISRTATEALEHDYVEDASKSVAATCVAEGKTVEVCSRCGDDRETTIPATGHHYESVVTAATCTSQGYTTYSCKDCDDSYVSDYVAALAHDYVGVDTEATCTTQGYTTYTCSHCTESYVSDYVAALGHSWDTTAACQDKHCTHEGCSATELATVSHTYALTSDTATCSADGVATYTCTLCSTATYTQTSLAKGHTLETDGEGNVIWTDTSDAAVAKEGATCVYIHTHTAKCLTCEEDVLGTYEVTEHNYALCVTKEATCKTAGTKQMMCTACGEVLTGSAEVTYYTEHSYDEGTQGTDCIVYTCSVCQGTKTTYTGSSATVSTDALKTDVQLGTDGAVISMSEDALSGLSESADLTLAADVLTDNDYLNVLTEEEQAKVGENNVYNITLEADGTAVTTFNGTITVKIPYTLAEGEDESAILIYYIGDEGLEQISAVYSDGYVVFETTHFSYYTVGKYSAEELCNKYGHNIRVLAKEATCTEAGYYIEICTRCNETITSETYNALGHSFKQTITKAATCTENGTVTYTCSHCGSTYTGVIAATGHIWLQNAETSEAATCQHAGHNDYYCSYCDAIYSVDIPQLSHNYTSVVTAPTCTEAGYTTYTCTLCGDTYKANYVAAAGHSWEVDADCVDRVCLVCGTTVPATADHTYENGSTICSACGHGCNHDDCEAVVTAPTCTEQGYTTYTCKACGLVTIGNIVSATGHNYVVDDEKSVAATCTTEGKTVEVCSHCGDERVTVLPKIDHDYEAIVTEATCTTNGYTTYTCSMCGDNYVTDYVEATGHHWNTEADCLDKTCLVCEAIIAATAEHTYEEGSTVCSVCGHGCEHEYEKTVVEATCTTDGYTLQVCIHCGSEIKSNLVEAYGHNYVVDEEQCVAATCDTEGKTVEVCSHCGDEKVTVIPMTEHDYVAVVTAPTCTTGGYTTYTCSACGDNYTADETEALGHDYVAVVTAPTCTEQGYTTYTCSRCGAHYDTDYVDAKGHTWKIDADCVDRECIYCDATVPATAEHNFVDGKCTACGTIDPDNTSLVDIFNAIIESCYNTDYTITLSDASMVVDHSYVQDGREYIYEYVLEDVELYITYTDGKIILYGEGSLIYTDTTIRNGVLSVSEHSGSATIYGDGEYLYLYYIADDEEGLQRVSYEYVLGDLGDYYGILGDEAAIAEYQSIIDEYLENELVQKWLTIFEDNSAQANELAAQVFFELFNGTATESGYEYTLDLSLLADLNDNLYTLTVSQLIDEYFGEGTYTSVSNYIAGLEDKTLYEVVTEILLYGEDFGVSKDLVFETINTVVYLYTSEEFDIESYLVDDSEESQVVGEMTISEILYQMTGLEDYSYLTDMIAQYGEINVYETLFGDSAEYLHETIAGLADTDVIAIVFVTDANYAVTSVKLVFNDATTTSYSYSYTGTVDEEGNEVATIYSTMTFTINGTINIDYNCNLPELCDSYKTEVEEAYAAVIESIAAACAESESGTIALDSYRTLGVNEDGTVYLVYEYYTYDWIYDEETGEESYGRVNKSVVLTDISKVMVLNVEKDCTGCYYIYMDNDDVNAYVYASFYIDTVNDVINRYDSFHDYQIIDNPDGVPSSADEVSCGEYYYTYYKCAICGEEYIVRYYKSHQTVEICTLCEGSTSCEDGVLVEEYCTVCNQVVYSDIYYWHHTYEEELCTLECTSDTYNGTVTYYVYTCACGYYHDLWWESDGYGCEFNECLLYYAYIYDDDGEEIGFVNMYSCYYTGCGNYYLDYRYYCNDTYGDNYYEFYQYNTETEEAELVCTFTYSEDSHRSEGNYTTTTDENGYTVEETVYTCKYCGYSYGWRYTFGYDDNDRQTYYKYESLNNGSVTYWYCNEYIYEGDSYDWSTCSYSNIYGDNYTYTTEYDELGRLIRYYRYEEYEDGDVYWYEKTYTYDSLESCHYYYTYLDSYGNEEYSYGYSHQETWFNNDNGTCTQPYEYGWKCLVCGTYTTSWTTVNGHSWCVTSDGTYVSYVCGRCGLESENPSSSEIYLEDFTGDSTYGLDGYISIGYYNSYENEYEGEYLVITYYLVPVGSQDNLDLSSDEYISLELADVTDTGSIYYISLDELKAWAEENNVSLTEYDLRVSFYSISTEEVTSITITDLVEAETTESEETTGSSGSSGSYSLTPNINTAIYLTLYLDGTYEFGFATYGLTENGTWTYANSILTLTRADGETTITSEVADGELSLYYDYGSGLTQTFTCSVTELEDVIGGEVSDITGNTYTYGGLVCIESNGNDEALIETAFAALYDDCDPGFNIVFEDDWAYILINGYEYYCDFYQDGFSITIIFEGEEVPFILSEDGSTLTVDAAATIDLSEYTEETLENPYITYSIVYTLVVE